MLMAVSLDMDFSLVGEEGSPERADFERNFTHELAKASGVAVESIRVKKLSAGRNSRKPALYIFYIAKVLGH